MLGTKWFGNSSVVFKPIGLPRIAGENRETHFARSNCHARCRHRHGLPTSRGNRFARQLWEALLRGDDFVDEIPADRWDADEYYDPEPGVPGRSVTRWGAFLDDVGGFDRDFFGMTEREATAIDPQHRLLLETSWDALEHAGLDPATLAGSQTGVFVGLTHGDYELLAADAGAVEGPYGFTGTNNSFASGRVSYTLGLHGPAVTVDTACSSGLMAVHHGLPQPARRRERPRPGRWRRRDARTAQVRLRVAAGHAVAHRPLPRLRRRGRRVRVRRGLRGAVAQAAAGCDAGRRPDPGRRARHRRQPGRPHREHRDAVGAGAGRGVSGGVGRGRRRRPSTVGLVEAHGTGTPVGDPIEYASLAAVYGIDGPCALGSVKTNFGHCQSTSGPLGLMKAILALQHGVVPQNLHFTRLPDELAAIETDLFVPQDTTPWPTNGQHPRRAAVSSYGLSGTNVHASPRAGAPEQSHRRRRQPNQRARHGHRCCSRCRPRRPSNCA